MDLTIDLDKFKLNIRVAVLVRTDDGILFEKGKDGYYFVLGGRVKIGESSLEAAKREVLEEVFVEVHDLKLVSLIENFFTKGESSFHEICFVYSSDSIMKLEPPENIVACKKEDLQEKDIRPAIVKKIITEEQNGISNFIIKL